MRYVDIWGRHDGRIAPSEVSREAFDRLIADEMTAMIDPNANERFRRIERMAKKEYGQRFWWAPGDRLPQ